VATASRSAATGHGSEVLVAQLCDELSWRDADRARERDDRFKLRGALADLEQADVGGVKRRGICELAWV
jgi:hypothetical protein